MAGWRKSSRCDHGQCVEVWPGHRMWVRASGERGQVLSVDRADWQAFLGEVRAGEWDRC